MLFLISFFAFPHIACLVAATGHRLVRAHSVSLPFSPHMCA